MLTLTRAVTFALAFASESQAEMDGMRRFKLRSELLVISVEVEVAGPGPCIEPRDVFLELKTFL